MSKWLGLFAIVLLTTLGPARPDAMDVWTSARLSHQL